VSAPPLVVVDRDGTIIDFHRDEELGAVVSAFHPSQLRLLPGAAEGLALLARAGSRLAIATNQPGPAKGQITRAAIDATNAALVELLAAAGAPIDAVHVCLHHPDGGPGGDASLVRVCACRKPAPGLLLEAAARIGAAPSACWMIGDADVDVAAARAAGFHAALVMTPGRCELCPLRGAPSSPPPDVVAPSIAEIAAQILRWP
jgi:D-glycero-D-manno-heptose 1,7-bisphosphate phosphatase